MEDWFGCTWLTELKSKGRRQEGVVCADIRSVGNRAKGRLSLRLG